MKNLNAEKIKKALECCTSLGGCKVCPYSNKGYAYNDGECGEKLLKDVLLLVNGLTEENERLREDNEIKSQKRANIFEIANAFERGRTDGVRKMLQRIKEDAVSVSLLSNPPKFMLEIREDALDQIAKEMLEGEK